MAQSLRRDRAAEPDERHARDDVREPHALLHQPVFAGEVAVVGHHDEDRVFVQALFAELFHETGYLVVD